MRILALLAVCLSAALSAAQPPAADACVAPDGDDGGPGSVSRPFATLARAQTAIRERIARGVDREIVVLLRGGTYRLAEPLCFTAADAGTTAHAVVWAAYPGETPIISGGKRISGWTRAGADRWRADIPEAAAGTWFFEQLVVDGRRAQRARFPDGGHLRVASVSADVTAIAFDRDLGVGNLAGQDAELVVLQNWSVSRARVVASSRNAVTAANPVGFIGHGDYTTTSPGKTAWLEHARAFVDQPGEWYLDRAAGELIYQGAPGFDAPTAEFVAPTLERLVTIAGTAEAPVVNLQLRGLTLAHAGFALPADGYSEIQAGHYGPRLGEPMRVQPVAIACAWTRGCAFDRCRIAHLAGSGVGFGAGCADDRVTGCVIEDIGGNGIMVGWRGEAALSPAGGLASDWADPREAPARVVIANNLIQRCGAASHGCVGIFAAFSADTRIAHNLVRDLPYTGISIGFRWDTSPTTQARCVVEANHIHDVMRLLADGGGIYTLGFQPGTTLERNWIHDVHRSAHTHGGAPNNGFFIDEGSKGFRFARNVVQGASGGAVRHNQNQLAWHEWIDNAFDAQPRPVPGRVGRALRCDGTVGLEPPGSAAVDPALLTVACWLRCDPPAAGAENRRWLVNKNGNEWVDGHWGLILAGDAVGAYLNLGGGQERVVAALSPAGSLRPSEWQHLAMTYDRTRLAVWLDGTLVAQAPATAARTPGATPIAIGRRQDGFVAWAGDIDEVRIYDRALTPERIRALAQAPERIDREGLVAEWTFDDVGPADAVQRIMDDAGPEPAFHRQLGLEQPRVSGP